MAESPDLEGFAAAQQELRDAFGEEIVFTFPAENTWPEGTQLDRETGEPFDPLIQPLASAVASAAMRGNFATKIEDPVATALGFKERAHVLCILPSAAGSAIRGADQFTAREELYKVVGMRLDGIGGIQRLVAGGRKM